MTHFSRPHFNPVMPKFPGMAAARERVLPEPKPDRITPDPKTVQIIKRTFSKHSR